MHFGWQELVTILVVILIVFGAGKLPEVVRSLGQGVKEIKGEDSSGEGVPPAGATSADAASRLPR